MNKFKQLKQAMKSPPPARLASIEYKSHFLQMIGISFVCMMLIIKGFWYIIFALIFGLGVSYSQGMTAYQKYKTILSITRPESSELIDQDISPSRRRSRIISYTLGAAPKWISFSFAAFLPMIVLNILLKVPTITILNRVSYTFYYLFFMTLFHIIIYYILIFQIANYKYKKQIKEQRE